MFLSCRLGHRWISTLPGLHKLWHLVKVKGSSLQTSSINQSPNSTCHPPPIRHLPTTLCLIIPNSSKTHPKYLNSETCSKSIPFTQTSHCNPFSPPCSYLHWLSDLFSYTPQQTIPPSPSGIPPTHHTKPSHLHTRGQAISTLFPPPKISLPSSLSPFSLSLLRPYIH